MRPGCDSGSEPRELVLICNQKFFTMQRDPEFQIPRISRSSYMCVFDNTHRSHNRHIGNHRASTKMTPQVPSITTRSGGCGRSRLALVDLRLCSMANWPSSTEQPRKAECDQGRLGSTLSTATLLRLPDSVTKFTNKQTNKPRPPRRVVIEHHAADAGWAARVLPMRAQPQTRPGMPG